MLMGWRVRLGESLPPQESLFLGVDRRGAPMRWLLLYLVAARLSPGRLALWASVQCLFKHNYQRLFSDLLLLPYLGTCIQMQIDLNPINPFNHVCECECVHAHVCEQTSHTYLYLYNSLGTIKPHHSQNFQMRKWYLLIFPGNFVNCSCALLINIS